MMFPIDRIDRHVAQGVWHPAHVPLIGKSEATIRDRFGDAGPCGRFLSDNDCAGTTFGNYRVQVPQEADCLQILSSAVDVWNPFARLAAVVAIEHGGDGVDPQTINVKMLKEMKRARDEEVLYFATAEIVDECVPVPL